MPEEHTPHSSLRGDSWRPGREPRQATPIGQPARAPVGIYLGNTAMERLETFLADPSRERVLGLLLGHPLQSDTRPFILVSEVLGPVYARPSGGLATELFTPQDLLTMEKAWEAEYPETTVVGWFYAGPHEEGVSLSAAQRRTHERYFTAPWQLTLTIDTARGASRLYRWEGESLRPCDDFYVWNTGREPLSALLGGGASAASAALATDLAAGADQGDPPAYAREDGELSGEGEVRPRSRMSWLRRLRTLWPGLLLLYILLPAAPGSIGWMQRLHAHQLDALHQLEAELYRLEEEAESLRALREGAATAARESATLADAGVNPAAGSPSSEPPQPEEAALRLADRGHSPDTRTPVAATLTPPTPTPASMPTLPPTELSGAATSYVIQPGDTMWRISGTLLGDPRSFRSLAEANNIEDPDRIYPGQRLRLP